MARDTSSNILLDLFPIRPFLPPQILHEIPQPCEAVAGIGIMLDDIKREVIRSAECPDGNGEKYRDFPGWRLEEQQHGSEKAGEEQEAGLGIEQLWIGDVGHGRFSTVAYQCAIGPCGTSTVAAW